MTQTFRPRSGFQLDWLPQRLIRASTVTSPRWRLGLGLIVVSLQLALTYLVYLMGGAQYTYAHAMYLPIVLAAILFSAPAGVLAGIVGGLLLGPWMPADVGQAQPQILFNWLYRLVAFALTGGLVGLLFDELRRQIRQVTWLAHHDPISGLPNITLLFHQLQQALQQPEPQIGLVMVQFENMSTLDEIFGCTSTSTLTRQVALRLQQGLPSETLVCRVYAHRLVILLVGQSQQQIERTLTWANRALMQPFELEQIPVHLETVIGYCTVSAEMTAREAMMKANRALSYAQVRGRSIWQYDIQCDRITRDSIELLGSLQEAIAQDQLRLHFQPKIDLTDGTIVGVEALVRWQHPTRGSVAPHQFIPAAENTTLIDPLTDWVLDRALRQCNYWKGQGIDLTLAVNISPRNLQNPEFSLKIRRLLKRYRFDPAKLELEITEGAMMQDPEAVINLLEGLYQHRLNIAIDDFGTGYSSLAYIHRLPVTVLKVDQSFVRDLMTKPELQPIVQAIIAVGHACQMQVVAEGIEDAASMAWLLQHGCDMGQGYWISRPLTPLGFEAWYQSCDGVSQQWLDLGTDYRAQGS